MKVSDIWDTCWNYRTLRYSSFYFTTETFWTFIESTWPWQSNLFICQRTHTNITIPKWKWTAIWICERHCWTHTSKSISKWKQRAIWICERHCLTFEPSALTYDFFFLHSEGRPCVQFLKTYTLLYTVTKITKPSCKFQKSLSMHVALSFIFT